ncbi:MAG TPA: hypothetical protein VIM02_02010 [Rhizomicrobium sp.]|jgi:hypothetical protein
MTNGADWAGLLAAFCGTVAAIILVVPLFILLNERENWQGLDLARQANLPSSPSFQKAQQAATYALLKALYDGRNRWKTWVRIGVTLLVLALTMLLLQAWFLMSANG